MIKAVIFDMNGVITNDERIHQEAWRQFLKKHKVELSEDDFKHKVFGRTEKEVFKDIFNKHLDEEEVAEMSDERVDIAIKIFKPKLAPTHGLIDFLQNLKSSGLKVGLATSSRKRYLNFILGTLRLREFFQAIVTSEDIVEGKPHPEIYLKTAQRLNIEPYQAVAFEDSLSGIKSAKAASMKVIALTTTHSEKELEIADKVISNFKNITPADLQII